MFTVFALKNGPPCPNMAPSMGKLDFPSPWPWLGHLFQRATPRGRGRLHGPRRWCGAAYWSWEDQSWTHCERPQITEVTPFVDPNKGLPSAWPVSPVSKEHSSCKLAMTKKKKERRDFVPVTFRSVTSGTCKNLFPS